LRVWRVSSQAIRSTSPSTRNGAVGDVFQIANGGRDHIEAAGHIPSMAQYGGGVLDREPGSWLSTAFCKIRPRTRFPRTPKRGSHEVLHKTAGRVTLTRNLIISASRRSRRSLCRASSLYGASVRQSRVPANQFPFYSSLAGKYSQTLRSIKVRKKTFAPKGMWCRSRTPLLKSISADISSSSTDRLFIRFLYSIGESPFVSLRAPDMIRIFVVSGSDPTIDPQWKESRHCSPNRLKTSAPPFGCAPVGGSEELRVAKDCGRNLRRRRRVYARLAAALPSSQSNRIRFSFNVESPVPCYGLPE